jgi:putative intracellular protease/amidase
MRALFIITSSERGAWLSEITHPYWHLTERGIEVDFASPAGGKIVWDPYSDPRTEGSLEPEDLVSKGFLSEDALIARLDNTSRIKDINLDPYDAVHVVGGLGAVYDLYPNEDVGAALEHFWARGKVVGVICHGAIALANIPDRLSGRTVTGYSHEEDLIAETRIGGGYRLPQYPQLVLEENGANYTCSSPFTACVVVDGNLVSGQNQQSASDFSVILYHRIAGDSPITHGAL